MTEEVKRYNIRMAGIGGQGVVTASHIVSNGVVISGGFSSLVPFFGSEKRNAPVESYVRISNDTIYEIGEIIFPNVLMIFHPSVITLGKSYTMPFYTGLKQNGIILINSKKPIPFTRDEQREPSKSRSSLSEESWLPIPWIFPRRRFCSYFLLSYRRGLDRRHVSLSGKGKQDTA